MTRPLYHGTNAIVQLFTNDRPLPRIVRKVVLRLSDRISPIKQLIMKRLTETAQVESHRH